MNLLKKKLLQCCRENKKCCKSSDCSTSVSLRPCAKYSEVPRAGVEPARVAPLVFETSASTDSAIWACVARLCSQPKAGAKVI